MGPLGNRVALVTGASSGIGRATAERLARDGASVVVHFATQASAAAEVVEPIEAQGGTALAIQADITSLADIRRLFAETIAHLGRLDILIANAGHSCFKPMADISETDFDRLFAVNAKGTFFCLQEGLRHLADGGIVSR